MKLVSWEKGTLLGAVIAAIAASLCCIGPLVLLAFGMGGAWLSTYTQLPWLRPVSIVVACALLILTFWKLYITPKHCADDGRCTQSKSLRIQRIIFWIIAVLVFLLVAFPWYACLFN